MNDFVKQPYKFGFPEKRGLYDPAMEKDSCGVGFVANIKGIPSHEIMLDAYPPEFSHGPSRRMRF